MIEVLEKSFKDYVYEDKNHAYYYTPSNKRLVSVTQFISRLKPKFEGDLHSTIKSFQASGYNVKRNFKDSSVIYLPDQELTINIGFDDLSHFNLSPTPEEIKFSWEIESYLGTERGTYLHNYLENLDKRQIDFPQKPNLLTNRKYKDFLDTEKVIMFYNSLKILENLANNFKKDNNSLIPVAIEYTIGSNILGIAGRFDRLYFNEETKEYEIWDFKTDKKLERKNKYGKIRLFGVDDCEYEKYSIQTSLYKYIIEQATGLKLGSSKIVWFDHKNERYEIIETLDYTSKINDLKNEYNWSAYI